MLFVPLARPFAAGRRGRFAVTLAGGGVMLEGEAEVISAATEPSPLHGRVGMTLRFVAPDAASKAVLAELARPALSREPSTLSVQPRAADVPPTPRATPPAPSGRIDASSALAECVAIGELSGLGGGRAPAPAAGKLPGKRPASAPAAVPAPPVVAARAGLEQAVEVSNEPTELTSVPPVMTGAAAGAPALITAPAEKSGREPRRTVIGIAVTPAGLPVYPASQPPHREGPDGDDRRDTSVMPAAQVELADPTSAGPPPSPVGPLLAPEIDAEATTAGPPPAAPPTLRQPVVEEPTPSGDWTMTPGADGPTIEPRRTERTQAPVPREPTKGPPTGDWMIALDPSRPDGWTEPAKIEKPAADERPLGPPASMVSSERALDSDRPSSHFEAWTDPDLPKVQIDPTLTNPELRVAPDDGVDVGEPAPPPVVPRPVGLATTDMQAAVTAPFDESSVVFNRAGRADTDPLPHAHAPLPARAHMTPPPGARTTIPRGTSPSLRALAPERSIGEAIGWVDPFGTTGTAPNYKNRPGAARRRLLRILATVLVALALGAVLFLLLREEDAPTSGAADVTGVGHTEVAAPGDRTPHGAPSPGPGSGQRAPGPDSITPATMSGSAAPPDAAQPGEVPPGPAEPAVAADEDCQVEITSTPPGAEIVIPKNTVLETTPATITLPCGVQTKLVLRKSGYLVTMRTVTPQPESKPVKVTLSRPSFLVKLSSTPPGATVTLRGRSIGVTPTTTKLPAHELATLTFTKPGYAPATHKLTPKRNHMNVHKQLEKKPRRRR